jgi:hypothetical protein
MRGAGRFDDSEHAQSAHHQLNGDRGQQDSEHHLGNDEAGGVQAFGQFVDVGEDQIVERPTSNTSPITSATLATETTSLEAMIRMVMPTGFSR